MRCLIAVNMPAWNNRITAGREQQAKCNQLAEAIRTLADKVQNCGVGTGDVVVEREHLVATMRIEITAAPAADAA